MLTQARCAVVGHPVAHSLSPVLHRAAYAALGLTGWRYDRVEVAQGALDGYVASLGPEWAGLSVTMPGKEEALALAARSSDEARLAGAANTLVRSADGWSADNTDVAGLAAALREAGAALTQDRPCLVTGGGATARSAVLALRSLGAREVTLLVRDRPRPETERLVEQLAADPDRPLRVRARPLADGIPLSDVDVVVGTLPAGAPAPSVAPPGATAPLVLDAVYAPWPSPLASAVGRATTGRVTVVRGTSMLLHQAARQVELMTGLAAPVEAMRSALTRHLGGGR